MSDLLIQNAEIADGSGDPPFIGDIFVQNGRIAEIRKKGEEREWGVGSGEWWPGYSGVSCDAAGLTAVPGFIDIHRHGDLVPFGSGEEAEELRQGITFFMNGSCGFSPVPSRAEFFGLLQSYARPIMGAIPDHLRGMDFAAFRRALEQMPMYSNMGCLCGGGALRIAVKGFDNSPMSAAEMDSLSGLLEGELDAGAFGLSLGLMYAPENFYSIEELEKICRIPARRGLPVAVHLWQEGNGLFDSIEKIIALAKKSGAAIHISHLKITGKQNWGKIGRALDRIVCARKEGLDITFDAYPYNAGSTALYALMPPARLNRGPAELIESLREPQMRRAIAAELQDANAAWDNVVPGIGWQGVAISGGRDASLSGLSVRDIAAKRGCSPEDCVFDLLLENDGNISVIIFSMDEADVEKVLGFPGAIVISDSLYAGALPHPRRFGSQARFLSRYAAALGFEKALCSVTSLPARRFGLKDRGLLRAGAVADIVLLDRALLRDTAVWEAPAQYPQGIARVFVSGKQAFNEQEGPVGKYGRLATYEGAA